MLQKYFPILSEVNSPLAALAALQFTASAAKVAIDGISNTVLESLLKDAVSSTETHRKEIEASAEELAAARVAAAKAVKGLRYRAAQAARAARAVSRAAKRVTATRKPIIKASLKGLSGLSIEVCRSRAATAQAVARTAVAHFNTAHEAAMVAIEKGGDTRAIRSCVAALKEATRLLEVRQLELRFAREMLAISLARHSA